MLHPGARMEAICKEFNNGVNYFFCALKVVNFSKLTFFFSNIGYNGASGHPSATMSGAPYSGGQNGQSNWNYNYYGLFVN